MVIITGISFSIVFIVMFNHRIQNDDEKPKVCRRIQRFSISFSFSFFFFFLCSHSNRITSCAFAIKVFHPCAYCFSVFVFIFQNRPNHFFIGNMIWLFHFHSIFLALHFVCALHFIVWNWRLVGNWSQWLTVHILVCAFVHYYTHHVGIVFARLWLIFMNAL